jgi:ribosomal-protein-alanine N-acetyltransferase
VSEGTAKPFQHRYNTSVAENLRQSPTAHPAVAVRPAYPRDAALLYHWRSEPSVRQHQPLSHLSMAQLRSEISAQKVEQLYRSQGEKFQWIVTAPEPVGWITLVVANWEHGLAEIGYALSTRHQRRGIMRRALSPLLDEIFERTSLRRVEARCAVENRASQKILEGLGFEREGLLRHFFVLRGRPIDNYLFALLREDWVPPAGPRGIGF